MTSLICCLLLSILCLGTFVLIQDTRMKRVHNQLAAVLPIQTAAAPVQSLRLHQDDVDWQSRSRYYLHLVLGYEPTAPHRMVFVVLGIIAAIAVVMGSHAVVTIWLAGLIGIGSGCLVVRSLFSRQRYRYANTLLRQMPDVLELIVSAIRAGLPVVEAFRAVAREMPQPTQEQFTLAVNDIALGRTPAEAVLAIFQRTRVAEYAIFSVTLAVQNKTGGRLAETIQTLSATVRERVGLAGRAKALAGEATLSARVLTGLPIVSVIIMYLTRPESFDILVHDPRGRVMSVIGTVLLLLGVYTMRRMIRKGTAI